MSAVVSQAAGEATASAPAFSYAQAAKGRSPSLSAAPQSSRSNPDNGEPTQRSASAHQAAGASGSETLPGARRASDGQLVKEKMEEALRKNDATLPLDTKPTLESQNTSSPATSDNQTQLARSPPPSPQFGSTSTSTLPKEDDVSATPNASSESTWDKISQTSQNAERGNEKTDGDDEDSKLSSWEHVPATATLKEAPPPAFNFWTKRAMDQQAKTTKEPRLSQSLSGNSNKDSLQQGAKKSLENAPDLGKLDGKKRAKSGQVSDDKSTSPTARDAGKPGDGRHQNPEDERRSYSSGRAGEAPKPAKSSSTPPPPPGDAISWPTPDLAQEDKKKSQDRSDKPDKEKTPAKPHGKEKWVPVPYVPTAVFNTPLPPGRRGGGRAPRGSREGGGRGGHAAHGSVGGVNAGDKPSTPSISNPGTPVTTGNDRSRGDMGPPRPGPLAPKSKRAVSAGPPTSREQQRKSTDPSTHNRQGDSQAGEIKDSQEIRSGPSENRRASTATQTEGAPQMTLPGGRNDSQGFRRLSQNTIDRGNGQKSTSQDHAHPRTTPDRRSEGSMRAPDSFRDYNGFSNGRNGEGRPDRGRGGFRGRGGYNSIGGNHSGNGQNPPSGQSSQQPSQGSTSSKSQSHTERTAPQAHVPSFTPQPRDRGHRANSRSQSIPNQTNYGRFPNGGPPPVAQHLPALQTDLANMYGYQPPAIMSAIPYQPYVEQIQLIGMVQMQMEYYLSLENLCKDMFLRKHMDSQGFAFLSLVMGFNRIRQLTSDVELVRYVCRTSQVIEIQTGNDGFDRVRKAEGWQQWVLNMDERDPTVRNETPVVMQQPPMYDPFRTPGGAPMLSPRSSGTSGQTRMGSLGTQHMNGIGPPSVPDAMPNSYVSNGQISQTHLSAAVPDFTPGLQTVNGTALSTSEPPLGLPKNTFSDEQVESLMIVIRKPHSSSTSSRPPFSSPASRTFSNGSIDGNTISDELAGLQDKRQGASLNGERPPENRDKEDSQRAGSPFNRSSGPKPPTSAVSPVFWVKDQEAPIDDLPNDLTHESYTVFRQNALQQREESLRGQCHRDMDILYQFWSHFLIRNFNNRMYDEFRQLAFEDSMSRDTSVGLRNLVMYYDESILSQKVIPDSLARDYVDLVRAEAPGKERVAFDRLRAAWRNGALNLKNRVKIDKILDADLKMELER